MRSRKRNKGRDRKAKKAELEAEKIEKDMAVSRNAWQSEARGEVQGRKLIHCDHGCSMVPEGNHIVVGIMDVFYSNGFRADSDKKSEIFNILKITFATYPEVWDNENYRQMTINILIKIGTNCLLMVEKVTEGLIDLATAVVVLENYDGLGDLFSAINCRGSIKKIRELFMGGCSTFRDLLKFFRKRTQCSCLKKMHLEARKTLPKLGGCQRCARVKERALLMVCSRCMIDQYCSRECQIADWSRHKKCTCDKFSILKSTMT